MYSIWLFPRCFPSPHPPQSRCFWWLGYYLGELDKMGPSISEDGEKLNQVPHPTPYLHPFPSENSGGNRPWVKPKSQTNGSMWTSCQFPPPAPAPPPDPPRNTDGFPGTQPSHLCRCARKGVQTPQQWEEVQAMESSILSFVDIFSVTRTSSWVLQFYVRPWNICIHIVFNVTFITFLRFRYSSIRLYRKKKLLFFLFFIFVDLIYENFQVYPSSLSAHSKKLLMLCTRVCDFSSFSPNNWYF